MKVKYEITDTFGGEANYSWVDKYEKIMPNNASMRSVLKEIRNKKGITCKLRKGWDDGETISYNFDGACIRMFITFVGDDE